MQSSALICPIDISHINVPTCKVEMQGIVLGGGSITWHDTKYIFFALQYNNLITIYVFLLFPSELAIASWNYGFFLPVVTISP